MKADEIETKKRGFVANLYEKYTYDRDYFLEKAYDAAELTIPALLPRSEDLNSDLPTPYQSIGGQGINALASKLLVTLLPPNAPFFRLRPTSSVQDEIDEGEDPNVQTEVDTQLAKVERDVMEEVESSGDRVVIHEGLLHLLVAGNVLLHMPEEGTRIFHLNSYVVRRNSEGTVSEIIVKESVDPADLPEEIQESVEVEVPERGSPKQVDLFTYIKRDGKFHRVHQEVNGKAVPRSHGTYPIEKSPWIALRFTRIDGESYGRSFVETIIGDLYSLEHLTKAIVDGSLAAAKVIFFVDPNGTTRMKTLAKAESGAIRAGNRNDVTTLQMDKFADFRVALETISRIEARLSRAFLDSSTVQRNGERVTAEEIRYMAQELEAALGGFYTILGQELQLPYVHRRLSMLKKAKRLTKKLVRPVIVTGLEALGRGNDLQKLDLFLQGAAQTVGPEAVQRELNVGDYLNRRATSLGINTKGLFKSPEQKAAEQQQLQQQQMVQTLGPEAVKQMGNIAQQQPPAQ